MSSLCTFLAVAFAVIGTFAFGLGQNAAAIAAALLALVWMLLGRIAASKPNLN